VVHLTYFAATGMATLTWWCSMGWLSLLEAQRQLARAFAEQLHHEWNEDFMISVHEEVVDLRRKAFELAQQRPNIEAITVIPSQH
jgi:hypothetical protein